MKKLFPLLALLIMIGSVAMAAKSDNPKPTASVAVMKSGSTFKLFYKGVRTGNVKVTIYDSKNQAVFSETIKNLESFMRPYNFSSLDEGEYLIELKDQDGTQLEKISYHKGHVERLAKLVRV